MIGGRPLYLDKQGRGINLEDWCRKFEDKDYQFVAKTTVTRGLHSYSVSTVWLGIDHNSHFEGPPIIFETMVFEDKVVWGQFGLRYRPSLDKLSERYSTEEQAKGGHERIVAEVRERLHGPT